MEVKNISMMYISESVEQTLAFGRKMAAELKKGDIISLTGPLGAGKTCFVKGLATGLGIHEDDIKSPSFTLVNEMYGRLPLYHFDLYRMKNADELYEIGWDDYQMRDGIVVVEWGEKAGDKIPPDSISIVIEIIDVNRRQLTVTNSPGNLRDVNA